MCWNPHASLDPPHAVCDFPHPSACSSFCVTHPCPVVSVALPSVPPRLFGPEPMIQLRVRGTHSCPLLSGLWLNRAGACAALLPLVGHSESLLQSAGDLHWTLVSLWPLPSVKPNWSFPAQKLPGRMGRWQLSRKQFLGLFELIVLMVVIEWKPGTH